MKNLRQIEAVFMPREGTADDLHFDAGGLRGRLPFLSLTAQLGLIRNLTPGEIVG